MSLIVAAPVMAYALKKQPMTAAEFLARDETRTLKHEFVHGDKFADYRALPSLREYLLIDVDRQRCELYRLGPDGLWVLHPGGAGEGVALASVDLAITPDDLWAELEPEAAEVAEALRPPAIR